MSTKRKPAQSGRLTAGKKLNGTNNNAITLGSQQVSHSQDDLFCGISATSRSGDSVDENFANSRLNDLAPGIVSPGVNSQNTPKTLPGENSFRQDMKTKSGYVGIHCLNGSIPYTKKDKCVAYLCGFFEQKQAVYYDSGHNGFQEHYCVEPYGVRVHYDSTPERSDRIHGGKAFVSIPGSALDVLSSSELQSLCVDLLCQFHFKATRLDTFFDDYKKRITPEQLHIESKKGNVSGFRKARYVSGTFIIGQPESVDGSGMYFGSRGQNGGGRHLRVYDKELETLGEIKAIRWELEASKEMAELQFFRLADQRLSLSGFSTLIGEFVGGCVLFVDREAKPSEKNIPRLSILGFWQSILDELGSIKLRASRKLPTIENTIAWVDKSVVPSLAKLRRALGPERFYSKLLDAIDAKSDNLALSQLLQVDAFWIMEAKFDAIPI